MADKQTTPNKKTAKWYRKREFLTVLVVLLIAGVLAGAALLAGDNNDSNGSQETTSTTEEPAEDSVVSEQDIVVEEVNKPAPDTEAGKLLTEYEERIANIDTLPEEERPLLYYDAALFAANFEIEEARVYAQEFLNYDQEGFPEEVISIMQLIADGEFSQALEVARAGEAE